MNKNNNDPYPESVITITQKLRSENEDLKQTVADQEHRIKKLLDALETIREVSCICWTTPESINIRSMFMNINQVAGYAIAYIEGEK